MHYVLYSYYADTQEFHKLQYHNMPARIDIPTEQLALLNSALIHNGESIIPYHIQERKKDDSQVRFDDKCKTAEKLGIIHKFKDKYGADLDFSSELIEIYSYRNAIHLVAEQRKGITYELELSKKAYRRMQPFSLDLKSSLAIIVFCVRRERFCDGLLLANLKNGVIIKCLERIAVM